MDNCLYCGNSLFGKVGKKFCDKKCESKYKQIEIEKRFELGQIYHAHTLRKIMIKRYGNICKKCKNEKWNNLPISIDVNHIDGNSNNNLPSNLELLCPNCHSLTSNHRGKNKK